MRTITFFDDDITRYVMAAKIKKAIVRGNRFKRGASLFLYGKEGRRRIRSTQCYRVDDVHISSCAVVILNDTLLTEQNKTRMAMDCGFDDFDAFFLHYKKLGLPIKGQLVGWL